MGIQRVARGVRVATQAGYIVGRLRGNGQAKEISVQELGQAIAATGTVAVVGSAPPATIVAGTANRITSSLAGVTYTIDISASYVGQASITTLGTISTGTWSATTIAVNKGGTGQTSYTDGQLLIGNTTGNTLAKASLTAPAAGITITGGAGAITFALANDLSALEGLSSTGLAARTASDTWAQRTITGTSNRITVTNGDGVSGNPTLDISSSYVGQNTITTLGTIGTGTWQGTKIGLAYGGTNADLSATGGSKQFVKQSSAGAALTVATIAATDLPDGAIWIGRQIITSTQVYTATSGATFGDVTLSGGGAGGGGVNAATAGNVSIAGSGAAGGVARKRVSIASITGTTCTIGAAGAGGASGANNGTAGGQSTFAGMTCNGGAAGSGAGAGPTGTAGTTAGGTASGGDINLTGGGGQGTIAVAQSASITGKGGDTPLGLGAGGAGAVAGAGSQAAGNAGAGYGAGGSGGTSCNAGTAVGGGAGTAGVCIIDEYR